MGYRVTGLKGYDEVRVDTGIAWFSLTRGCLVVAALRDDTTAKWYPTYALGEPEYEAGRAYLRAALRPTP